MTILRLTAALAAGALAVGLLTACSPEPEPTPTPLFSSEEEAFAAAEEVYRAYNDALNDRRRGNDLTDPNQFLTGTALELEHDAQRTFDEMGVRLSGDVSIVSFRGEDSLIDSSPAAVEATVCIDSSMVQVIDADGADVTPADRPDVSPVRVTFVAFDDKLLISNTSLADGVEC